MWIDVNFDEHWFPEPVWNGLYVTARALRRLPGSPVERVRVEGRAAVVDGRPSKVVRVTITARAAGTEHVRVFEFARDGRWRGRSTSGDDAPFDEFLPGTKHEYERDLINRPELQIEILLYELPLWLAGITNEAS